MFLKYTLIIFLFQFLVRIIAKDNGKSMGEYGKRDRHCISYNPIKRINSLDQNNGRSCLRSSLSWVLSKETCLWKWGHNHVGHERFIFHGPSSIKLSAESFVGINNITNKVEEAIYRNSLFIDVCLVDWYYVLYVFVPIFFKSQSHRKLVFVE